MSCISTLKDSRFKLTPQRRIIVDIIQTEGGHITAEEIIKYVQNKMPGVNKSTIYRTLELLEKAGCVFKSESAKGSIYHHADESHHHHLICEKCGKTVDFNENVFRPVEKYLNGKYGFQVDFKHIVISGICASCVKTKEF